MTRHNAGFLFLDHLAETLKIDFSPSKWKAGTAQGIMFGTRVLLFKPESYMNLSGPPLVGAASYYRVPPENIVVVHDDLDLDLGALKISVNRGAGGHKGVSSIIKHLGSKNFIRMRIGIGRPESMIPVEKYVLLKMSDKELEVLEQRFNVLVDGLETILAGEPQKAMNRVNETSGTLERSGK